jgi:hypothetical protein
MASGNQSMKIGVLTKTQRVSSSGSIARINTLGNMAIGIRERFS